MNASKILAAAMVIALAGCTIDSTKKLPPPEAPPLPPPPSDTTAPTASIAFPARDSFSAGNLVRVHGRASDVSSITEVRVNGVAATSTDGFTTWSADVPLVGGDNLLNVTTRDTHGNASTSAATRHVWQRTELSNAAGGEINAAGTALYFVDAGARSISAVAIDTGNITRVADLTRFSMGAVPLDLALDLANNRIYLGVRADDGTQSTIGVWAFDTQAQTWSVVSDVNRGGGPALQNPTDLVLDAAGSRLLVVDWSNGLFAVDLTTGARTLVSSNSFPNASYPLFAEPMDLVLDSTADRALIIDRSSEALFSVSLASGARTPISQSGVQTGIPFSQPLAMALDLPRNRALVWDSSGSGGTIAVDLATGIRSVFAHNDSVPVNPDQLDLLQYDTRTLAIANGQLYGIDTSYDAVQSFNLLTGARTRVANGGFPGNLQRACSRDAEARAGVLTLLSADGRLLRVGTDGTRTQLAGAGMTGSAPLMARALELDATGNIAYVASYDEILRVDLTSGAVTLLSNDSTPANQPSMPTVRDIVLDGTAGRIYALSPTSVTAINLADGVRTELSAANNALAMTDARQAVLDRVGNRLIVVDNAHPHLVAVDLTTGIHSEFSGVASGGPALTEPTGVGMDGAGNLWVIDDRAALLRVDRTTGARVVVSTLSTPDNLNTLYLWDRPIADGTSLYLQATTGGVLQIDQAGGSRIGTASCGAGGAM